MIRNETKNKKERCGYAKHEPRFFRPIGEISILKRAPPHHQGNPREPHHRSPAIAEEERVMAVLACGFSVYIYIYTRVYVCIYKRDVCVCVCVCVCCKLAGIFPDLASFLSLSLSLGVCGCVCAHAYLVGE